MLLLLMWHKMTSISATPPHAESIRLCPQRCLHRPRSLALILQVTGLPAGPRQQPEAHSRIALCQSLEQTTLQLMSDVNTFPCYVIQNMRNPPQALAAPILGSRTPAWTFGEFLCPRLCHCSSVVRAPGARAHQRLKIKAFKDCADSGF